MRIASILNEKEITLSCEVFPPKHFDGIAQASAVAQEIAGLHPSFMSVTYGAAGSTPGHTIAVAKAVAETGVTPLCHLTCVQSTREHVQHVLADMKTAGMENVLALRGDLPFGWTGTNGDLHYATELVKFVRKELKGMIDDGMFLEGHLDEEETSLITSDDSYVHYLEVKQKQAVQHRQEVVETKKQQDDAEEQKRDARVQEVLDRGNAFIRDIRACNDAIPGQEISDKISRMETLVRKIFDRVEEHPEVVPELKKLMDYYLPMTVKLLKAYADMDAQPVQGENIQNSKREIEATLDTLNTAFEKLLDSVFQDTAMDVSSDISVLHTLLAQEGLTDDGLSNLKKREN
mgnify:CR=1 FL=1